MISLRMPPNLPWEDHYGLGPFREGSGQRAIAEKAAAMYDQSNLAGKGGIFYHLYNSKDRVSIFPTLCLQCQLFDFSILDMVLN